MTNILEFLEKATSAVDEGKPFDVVYLDFAKAFDKVPREETSGKTESAWRLWVSADVDPKLADGKAPKSRAKRS